jgi:altronate dehydratase
MRNILGITTTVQCVSGVVEHAVRRIRAEVLPKYPNVAEKQSASRGASRTVSAFSTLDSMSRLSAPCARVSLRLRSVMKCLACGL